MVHGGSETIMGYGIIDGARKWPAGRIPINIDELSFPPGSNERAVIDAAVAAWNKTSSEFQVVPRIDEADYVHFVPDELQTASRVGRDGGMQQVVAAYFPPITAGAS